MSATLPKEVEETIVSVLDRMGLNLVLGTLINEKSGRVLRLLIERKDATPEKGSGVDVALCASTSREISTQLDVTDAISDAFTLEVSSPGIERPLVNASDFDRFSGRMAKIKTKKLLDGSRTFEGVLNGLKDKSVSITTKRGDDVLIPNEMIKKAHLVFDYKR